MFRKLLVVSTDCDGDEQSLVAGAALAKSWGAELSVLAVGDAPAEIDDIARTTGLSRADVVSRLLEEQRKRVTATVDRILPGGKTRTDAALGKPFIEIIRYVLKHRIDMVVKTAEGLSSRQRFLFASTDQHLLRKCPCPIWLRRHDCPTTLTNVLAAVDIDHTRSAAGGEHAGLNQRIIDTATRLATGDDAVVHVLHAWDAVGESLVRTWSGARDSEEAAETYVNEIHSAHRRKLETLVAGAVPASDRERGAEVPIKPRLQRGAAMDVIPEEIHALGADVLVMGTIARTGIPGFIIGNTAEDILNSVDCSVVTVKPPGYLSPIKLD